MSMKWGARSCLAVAVLGLAACSQPAAQVASGPAAAETGVCASPESGFIAPESPGLPLVKLEGPFLVKSLMVVVDPNNPDTNGSILWSKDNMWLKISDFKGDFYLAEGETLTAQVKLSPWKTIYSGCRLE